MLTNDPEEHALLARICADPKDDAPRWIIADWYDEHAGESKCEKCDGCAKVEFPSGQKIARDNPWVVPCELCNGKGTASNGFAERAEFIRVQLRLAEMDETGEGATDPHEGHTCFQYPCLICQKVAEYQRLEKRAVELLEMGDNAKKWNGLWAAKFRWLDAEHSAELRVPNYYRGLVSQVRASWAWWQDCGEVAMQTEPLETVFLTKLPEVDFYPSDSHIRYTINCGGKMNHTETREEAYILWEKQWPTIGFFWAKEVIDVLA